MLLLATGSAGGQRRRKKPDITGGWPEAGGEAHGSGFGAQAPRTVRNRIEDFSGLPGEPHPLAINPNSVSEVTGR